VWLVDRKRKKQGATFEDDTYGLQIRQATFKPALECKWNSGAEAEKKKRKDKIDPRDARQLRIEFVIRRGNLAMVHPRRENLIRNCSRKDHREDGKAAQGVESSESLESR